MVGKPANILAALRPVVWLLLALFGFSYITVASAQDHKAGVGEPLTVGVHVSPPFVLENKDGSFSGMAIDLWETVAQELKLDFRYRKSANVGELIEETSTGRFDVALSNLSITEDRAELIDFTHPWYDAGLRVMVDKYDDADFFDIVAGLYETGHLQAYAWLALVILVATIGLTLFDRRFDKNFPTGWREGIAESFYSVMSVATSGRPPSRKNLFGWLGRIWQSIWLICGIAVLAYVTSTITSVMTTISLHNQIDSVADLPGKTVGVVSGSVAEKYARSEDLHTRPFDNVEEAAAALIDHDIDAIIADAPVLEYYIELNPGAPVEAVGPIFADDKYGFGLTHSSPLTRALSVEIIGEYDSGRLQALREKYFGERE